MKVSKLKTLFLGIVIFSAIPLSPVSALEDSDGLNIVANVPGCILTFRVKPEKRIPSVNNWDTILKWRLLDKNGSLIYSEETATNTSGSATVDLCALGIYSQPDLYKFSFQGYSHLNRVYDNVYTFDKVVNEIDFGTTNRFLLAGETSVVNDQKINILDLSTQVRRFGTNDYKNDLNQDGKVNSLDFSNTLTNYYLQGE
jgi:hypothetical protein